MKTSELTFDIRHAQVEIGRGRVTIADVYSVIATKEDGTRYQHYKGFDTMRAAACLLTRIKAADAIDLQHWDEIEPAYGSRAYQRQGVEFDRWVEERQTAMQQGG